MDFLKIIFLSFFSIIVLFFLAKLMGNREMSQLTMFDYILGISIGSIAAEMATSLNNEFWQPLIAMVIYSLVTFAVAKLSCKSLKFRAFFSGKPKVLFDEGKFFKQNFKKSNLDLNEFLAQCRINGYFNLSDIQTATLEENGRISFLPNVFTKPASIEDLKSTPIQNTLLINVIMDGIVIEDNLNRTGNSIEWLNNELKKQKISSINTIFLATCDNQNNLSIYS